MAGEPAVLIVRRSGLPGGDLLPPPWADPFGEEEQVQFRLLYKGPLPSRQGKRHAGAVVKAQHNIRTQLHTQLQDLCFRVPDILRLVAKVEGAPPEWKKYNFPPEFQQLCEEMDPDLSRANLVSQFNGVKFIPVIVNALHLTCELDILFLRRELPGGLIKTSAEQYGGDIDNRLKVLFDALRPPQNADGLPKGAEFRPDQKSMLCLLEDDALITRVQVESDTLLGIDLYKTAEPKDVMLVIKVIIKRASFSLSNIQFAD